MPTVFTTYFDKNYLALGLTMIRSLCQYRHDIKIVIICLDVVTISIMKKMDLQNVILVPVQVVEEAYPELDTAKTNRTKAEYIWTLTPFVLLYIMTNVPEGTKVIYLDADQMFFNDPEPLFKELEQTSVLIQPHAFPERLNHLTIYGIYNVGALGVRKNFASEQVITWWKDSCLASCSAVLDEHGNYGDQKYLEMFSTVHPDVAAISHPGIGVAPWNHENAELSVDNTGSTFFGTFSLILFHFHSFKIYTPQIFIPTIHYKEYCLTQSVLNGCYIPYCKAILKSFFDIKECDPSFGQELPTITVTTDHPLLMTPDCAAIEGIENYYDMMQLEDGFRFYTPSRKHIGWSGNYPTWDEACRHSQRYDTDEVFQKTLRASRLVRDGEAVCDRDSVLFQERQYIWPSLAGLLLGAARNQGELHVVDYGGALGSTYRTLYPMLSHLKQVRWHVVDLPRIVKTGLAEFQSETLLFHYSLEECLENHRVDGFLMSASLQYLPEPYLFLSQSLQNFFDYVILDRLALNKQGVHQICVQNVPPEIYTASYPCHLLDYHLIVRMLRNFYTIIDTFPALDDETEAICFKAIVAVIKPYLQGVKEYDVAK